MQLMKMCIRERTIIGSELDRGRFKWIGSQSGVMNDADRRCNKIHERGDKCHPQRLAGQTSKTIVQ